MVILPMPALEYTVLVVAGVSELSSALRHAVAPVLAALHQLHRTMCSFPRVDVRHLAELEVDLELRPPHPSQRRLKLAQFILSVEADQPQALVILMVI